MPTVPNENPAPAGTFGPDGLPKAYDWNWQKFTGLTPAQMAWYRSQPQWFAKYCCVAHWHKEIFIIDNQLKMSYQDGSSAVNIPDATQTFPTVQDKIATIRQSMANVLAQINAPGVTTSGLAAATQQGLGLATPPPITSTDQIDAIIAGLNVS